MEKLVKWYTIRKSIASSPVVYKYPIGEKIHSPGEQQNELAWKLGSTFWNPIARSQKPLLGQSTGMLRASALYNLEDKQEKL